MTISNSTTLTERFQEALTYAFQLHKEQRRKDNRVPYIAHLLSVAALVLEAGGDEDEAIAALLHDAVEDQGGAATREEIKRRFGERVTAIVDGCTESDTIPKLPWKERKLRYLAQIQTAGDSVLLVSLADKLHNSRDLLAALSKEGSQVWARFKSGKSGTLWFYRSLLERYKLGKNSGQRIQEFARIISELEKF